ncbi:MAG: beta-propeller fold lactonase family protein [Terriglobales bacterium]
MTAGKALPADGKRLGEQMSKKISLTVVFVSMCVLSSFLLSCGSTSSRPSGLLYVLTQGINGAGNNISSFSLDLSSGSLSLLNDTTNTCSTSNSCGLPLDIVLDPTAAVAFVLNQGVPASSVAPTIYAYSINSDGSLGATPSSAAATLTLGDTPVAMTRDAAGQYLFVIDVGADPSAANCQYQPQNNLPNIQCASVSVFSMQSGSPTLTPVSGSPFPLGRVPSAVSALTFPVPNGNPPPPACPASTSSEEFLYITFNSDPALHNDSTLSTYCIDSSGAPHDITPNVPYNTQTDPISVLAVDTNPVGQPTSGGIFVYVGSQPTASGALGVFKQDTTTSLLVPVVGNTTPATGQNPIRLIVDPTNNFLYVACQQSNQIFGYRINTAAGTLAALNPPYQPTGSGPVSMAMHPSTNSSGEFLYTSNNAADSISVFSVSTTSGAMSSQAPVIAPAAPSGMAAR